MRMFQQFRHLKKKPYWGNHFWAKGLLGHERNFMGMHFWARGYCVSTVGLNEEEIRRYIGEQEEFDQHQSRLEFK